MSGRIYPMRISEDEQAAFTKLARSLGYTIQRPGANFGKASPPEMVRDLVRAYRANPAAVVTMLRALGLGRPTAPTRHK